jgi:hypothetical protein
VRRITEKVRPSKDLYHMGRERTGSVRGRSAGLGAGAAGWFCLSLLIAVSLPSTARCGELLSIALTGAAAPEPAFSRHEGEGGLRVLLGFGIPDEFRPHAGLKSLSSPAGRRGLLPAAGFFAARNIGDRLTAGIAAGLALPESGKKTALLPVVRTALHLAVAF